MTIGEKQTRTLVYRNAPIKYYFFENKGKDTIVMLHPAFADHHIFELQTDDFKENYQLILIDMPGHGESQLTGSKVTLAHMPDILNQLCADNGIPACHLLGVSMGSLAAQAFAHRYPDRVKSVVAVGGYSIHKANEGVLTAQRKEGLKWMLYILFSMKKFRSYVTTVSCHTASARDLFDRGIRRFGRKSFSAMAGMNAFFTKSDDPAPYPLLLIVGEYDLKLAHDAAREWHGLETNSQLVLLPEAGHCANADTPDEFNRVLESFLSAVRD